MIADYSKVINLDEWPPKLKGQKEVEPDKTDPNVPDWAKPFTETISKTEQLIKEITDKKTAPEPLLGKPETENGVSPAVQDYLNRNKK